MHVLMYSYVSLQVVVQEIKNPEEKIRRPRPK